MAKHVRQFRSHIAQMCFAASLCFAATSSSASSNEYKLAPGDAIELSVSTVNLNQRSVINLNGEIDVRLIGPIRVAGLPLSAVRKLIQEQMSTKALRVRGPDGQEGFSAVEAHDIVVNIAEYRPVYLTGDVAKPGELVFRPFMTIRQAVAMAGGYDLMRMRMGNPFLETIDLRSEYDVLWMLLARQQTRIARLEAELNGKREVDLVSETGSAAPSVVLQIARLEGNLMKTRSDDYNKETEYLESAISQAQSRLSVLEEQQKKESEGVQLDAADLDRQKGLYEKGQGTIMRLTDARRALLLSSTRQLQTVAQASQIELQRQELVRKLQKVDDDRKAQVNRELQDALVELNRLRSRLGAVSKKMLYVGAAKTALIRSTGEEPTLTVFRKTGQGETSISADEGMELKPGDVVQITLKNATAGLVQ